MRIVLFMLAIFAVTAGIGIARAGAELSVVRGLRRLRQPELWVHDLSAVPGGLERQRRLL